MSGSIEIKSFPGIGFLLIVLPIWNRFQWITHEHLHFHILFRHPTFTGICVCIIRSGRVWECLAVCGVHSLFQKLLALRHCCLFGYLRHPNRSSCGGHEVRLLPSPCPFFVLCFCPEQATQWLQSSPTKTSNPASIAPTSRAGYNNKFAHDSHSPCCVHHTHV